MPRHCFALDLKNDPDSIARYRKWHAPGEKWAAAERIYALSEQP